MNRDQKQSFVDDFKERVGKAPVFYLTDFTGLSVKDMTQLRMRLRESGAEYLVAKNRLVIRALTDTEIPDITEHLADQVAGIVRSIRQLDLKKSPSVSETLDWARTLMLLNIDNIDEQTAKDTLNVLLKYQTDTAKAAKETT